jgi:CHAD domain-containing protein
MSFNPEEVQRPFRKLLKLFKQLTDDPSLEDVHEMRTESRRLEAVAVALTLNDEKPMRHLLKLVGPIRKAAGTVRDMDVLMANALTLSGENHQDSLVRLLEHLGGMRMESAHKLHDAVEEQRKGLSRSLRQCSALIEKRFAKESAAPKKAMTPSKTDPLTVLLDLMEKLARKPRLSRKSIHSFRIKVKQIRNILQLFEDANVKLVKALGEVKDEIGAWHDWQELATIAREVLTQKDDGGLIAHGGLIDQIEGISDRKFKRALTSANGMRRHYLGSEGTSKVGGKPRKGRLGRRTAGPAEMSHTGTATPR